MSNSVLRSSERLLEGNIGGIGLTPLIGYSISIYELGLLHPNIGNDISSLFPPISVQDDLIGYVNLRGRDESSSNSRAVTLSSFIRQELMRLWALPKEISIGLYEEELETLGIIRPRVINNSLVVEEVSSIAKVYCGNTFVWGLGERDETKGIRYWPCNYIERLRIKERLGLGESWIEWVSL